MKKPLNLKLSSLLIMLYFYFYNAFPCDTSINKPVSCRILKDTSDVFIFEKDTYANISNRISSDFKAYCESIVCDSLISNLNINRKIQECFNLQFYFYFLFNDQNKLVQVIYLDEKIADSENPLINELIVDDIKEALFNLKIDRWPIDFSSSLKYFKINIDLWR